jgi:hypothetical protein
VKNAILKVADDIEKSLHYTGKDWWDNRAIQGEQGCASSRIFVEMGAKVVESGSYWAKFEYKGHNLHATNVEGFIENMIQDGLFGNNFLGFSLRADNIDTAKRLREIADKIDITEYKEAI